MPNYYVETSMGCGIREARSLRSAEVTARREAGTYNEPRVRLATEADIAWVKAMGGWVPEAKTTVDAR